MTRRTVLLLLGLALLVAPGCELVMIPIQLLDTLASVLFFWAKAPVDAALPAGGPALADGPPAPVPLRDALDRALELGATGRAWVVPEPGSPPPDASRPPFPGAVLRSVRVVDGPLDPAYLRDLRNRGLEVRRPRAP